MPIYEYRCPKGHLFELFQRMDDAPPKVCEVCGASPLEKVLHPVPIFFKGKGFYSTDYGRKSRKRESGDGETAKPDKKPEKTETKKAEPAS
jgi:putative FmdB family regulatory protein